MMVSIRNRERALWVSKWISILLMLELLSLVSCEVTTTVPYDLPDHEPVPIIHGVASPQSGALVLLKYSQPLSGLAGGAPDLPEWEVYLLENGKRQYRFDLDSVLLADGPQERNRQIAYFRIPADSVILHENTGYSLEVISPGENRKYESSEVFLPPQPMLTDWSLDSVSDARTERRIFLNLGAPDKNISCISIRILPADPDITVSNEYQQKVFENLIWPQPEQWTKYTVSSVFNNKIGIDQDSAFQFHRATLRLAYLSYDLSYLLRQQDESLPVGEEPFADIYPFHSNFRNTPGIFGLYNEVVQEFEIE